MDSLIKTLQHDEAGWSIDEEVRVIESAFLFYHLDRQSMSKYSRISSGTRQIFQG